MYISFDLLIKIGQVILIAAGCAVLIYLALVFKHLVTTIKETTKTLEVLQKDLEKLESPLETVETVSKTVDELNASVKKTATAALGVMDDGLSNLKDKFSKPKPVRKSGVNSQTVQNETEPESEAEFIPITSAPSEESLSAITPMTSESSTEQSGPEVILIEEESEESK